MNIVKEGARNWFMNVIRGNIGIISVLIILFIALSLMSPVFLTYNNIMTVLNQISINTIIAIGMTFVIILAGIDLSVGAIVAMSGTLTVGFMVSMGMPVLLAIPIGLALGAIIGFINGTVVNKFRLHSFIVTLATMNIARGIAYVYSGGQAERVTDSSYTIIATGKVFGIIPLPVVYMFILLIIFSMILNNTKFGTYTYAIGGNREAARFSGVPIKKVEVTIYMFAGLLAAFAGIILSAKMYSGQPSVGDGYELDAIAACVLGGTSLYGGRGSISGTFFGAMVIGIISNGMNLLALNSFWQLIVKGVIIMIAIIIDSQKEGQSKLSLNIFKRNKQLKKRGTS